MNKHSLLGPHIAAVYILALLISRLFLLSQGLGVASGLRSQGTSKILGSSTTVEVVYLQYRSVSTLFAFSEDLPDPDL